MSDDVSSFGYSTYICSRSCINVTEQTTKRSLLHEAGAAAKGLRELAFESVIKILVITVVATGLLSLREDKDFTGLQKSHIPHTKAHAVVWPTSNENILIITSM